jgi:hypothetical protein
VPKSEAFIIEGSKMDENHCRVLGAYSGQIEKSLVTVSLRVLEQVLWQRSLDAIRDQSLISAMTFCSLDGLRGTVV